MNQRTLAQLLAFIRFINENQITNQFFICKEFSVTTKCEDVFDILNDYLINVSYHGNRVQTERAPSMVGCIKGLVSFIKKQNVNVITTHCFLHREALMSKTLGEKLKEVLDTVVQMVNFVKIRPIKTRIFEQICINMNSQPRRLILHTDVRWLSRGKVLTRITTRTSHIF